MSLRLCVLLSLAAAAPGTPQAPEGEPALAIANYVGGETVRYPVPLIRGTIADPNAASVTVVNQSSDRGTREIQGLVHAGRFKALTELIPGENELLIRAGEHEQALTLRYRPQTNPYIVRVIYFTDQSGNTDYQTPVEDDRQDFRGKLDTAMKLMQTFTAESLHDLGLGRRTFALELGDDGRVKINVLRGDKAVAEYHKLDGGQLYGEIGRAIAEGLPHPTGHNLAIPAFTRFDPETKNVYAHTALGGGSLALFGGGNLFAWPDSLAEAQRRFVDATRVDPEQYFSDSVGRHTFWAIASTTIGAALHELGHTFGLPHSSHPQDIMTRGFDRFNRAFTLVEPPHAGRAEAYEFKPDEVGCWAPVSAEALAPDRFFALDARDYSEENKTSVRLDLVSRSVVIESETGLRYVGVNRYGPGVGVQSVYHVPLGPAGGPPRRVEVPIRELGKRLGTANVSFRAIDDQGLSSGVRMPELLAGPYVQSWRFASVTRPWADTSSFPVLSAQDLAAIEASAADADLARSRNAFVDFGQLAPSGPQENTAAYALRIIRSDRPRKVRILTGSDDALRLWLNGELVAEVLALRGASPDAETTLAELAAGDNRLLVEVSQATGGWGLYLRLEDEAGSRLDLTDQGDLVPVDTGATEEVLAVLRGPFVRKWHFAPATRPWTDKSGFVRLTAEELKSIEAAALSSELAGGDPDSRVVDFLPRFPEESRVDVAGYAARMIHTDRPRTVDLRTGSDDSLRMWLNGEPIGEVLVLRPARPDSESTQAQLRAGENVLLVEVSQGAGDWGLALRIEDADGKDLLLTDDGRLVPLE